MSNMNYFFEKTVVDGITDISIEVHPEKSWKSVIPYFKVYDASRVRAHGAPMIRLHILDEGYEIHNKGESFWHIHKSDSKHIHEVLLDSNKRFPSITNWQLVCFYWNEINGLLDDVMGPNTNSNEALFSYLDGDYDYRCRKLKGYVPSTTKIPKKWVVK